MNITDLKPGALLSFPYLNHENKETIRVVEYRGLQYGCNEWYPEPQWFMLTHDEDRDAPRSFALSRIDPLTIKVL